MNNRKIGRKAQVWYIDFMVGLLILILTLLIYYQYQGNILDQSESDWQEMIVDSKAVTSNLISEGYPSNWTNSTVEAIGITDGNYRINQTKLLKFENMTYKSIKSAFKTRFEFYFFLEDKNGIPSHYTGLNATDPELLVQTARFVIYNSSIHRMVLHLWKA